MRCRFLSMTEHLQWCSCPLLEFLDESVLFDFGFCDSEGTSILSLLLVFVIELMPLCLASG